MKVTTSDRGDDASVGMVANDDSDSPSGPLCLMFLVAQIVMVCLTLLSLFLLMMN
jgi:hypothetical protein